ncbi:MAG: hypothetical protein ABSH28_22585 [Acidobacteriota bacterium]
MRPTQTRIAIMLGFLALIALGIAGTRLLHFPPGAPIQKPQKAPIHIPETITEKLQNSDKDIYTEVNVDYAFTKSLDAMLKKCDIVVRGRPVKLTCIPCQDDTRVCTQVRFKVHKILWGSIPIDRHGVEIVSPYSPEKVKLHDLADDEISIIEQGGEFSVSGRRVKTLIIGQKYLRLGKEYVVFLHWRTPVGRYGNNYVTYSGNVGVMELDGDRLISWDDGSVEKDVRTNFRNSLELLEAHLHKLRGSN